MTWGNLRVTRTSPAPCLFSSLLARAGNVPVLCWSTSLVWVVYIEKACEWWPQWSQSSWPPVAKEEPSCPNVAYSTKRVDWNAEHVFDYVEQVIWYKSIPNPFDPLCCCMGFDCTCTGEVWFLSGFWKLQNTSIHRSLTINLEIITVCVGKLQIK